MNNSIDNNEKDGGETYRVKNYGGNSVRFANLRDLGSMTRTNKSEKDNLILDGFSHYINNLKQQ